VLLAHTENPGRVRPGVKEVQHRDPALTGAQRVEAAGRSEERTRRASTLGARLSTAVAGTAGADGPKPARTGAAAWLRSWWTGPAGRQTRFGLFRLIPAASGGDLPPFAGRMKPTTHGARIRPTRVRGAGDPYRRPIAAGPRTGRRARVSENPTARARRRAPTSPSRGLPPTRRWGALRSRGWEPAGLNEVPQRQRASTTRRRYRVEEYGCAQYAPTEFYVVEEYRGSPA